MVMGTERSKALHNFTMPCALRWGNQRYLRCMKVNSNSQISTFHRFNANDSDYQHQQRRRTREKQMDSNGLHKMGPAKAAKGLNGGRKLENGDDVGISAVRQKVMFDLQSVADQMRNQIFKEGLEEGEVFVSPSPPAPRSPPPPAAYGIYRPWNMRTKRAACKLTLGGSLSDGSGKHGGAVDGATAVGNDSGKAMTVNVLQPSSSFSPLRTHLRIGIAGAAAESPRSEKRERAKFSVPLLRREIEEDFRAVVGHRPPRRPKKRAKIVQKELDTLFPGLWLSEITLDTYKAPEAAP